MFCIRSLQQCCDDTQPSDVRPPTPRMLADPMSHLIAVLRHSSSAISEPAAWHLRGRGCGGSRKKNLSLAKNDSEDEMESRSAHFALSEVPKRLRLRVRT
jgi:hypothetical protein